jgi:voltage-gated potassium channel Kch
VIEALHDDYITCGFDRFGRRVVQRSPLRETLAR